MRPLLLHVSVASTLASLVSLGACAGSDSGSELTPTGAGGLTATGGKGGGIAAGGSATAGTGGSSSGGFGGIVGGGGAAGAAATPSLSADDINYGAKTAVPAGQSILFNDWGSSPNRVLSMTADGATTTEVFSAFRVWSMGVSKKVDRIAFACGDPAQEAHYGVAIGDAIQNTWMYDVAATTVELMAAGNVNDECHTFSPDDKYLYVCRRAGFSASGGSPPYALARIDTTTRLAEQLTEPTAGKLALHPQPLPGGEALLYTEVAIAGTTQDRSIRKLDLATKTSTLVRQGASSPSLSADGSKYVFTDFSTSGLWVAPVAGAGAPVQVSTDAGTSARFSPDGATVAYLREDKAGNCSSIVTVAADGSTKNAPKVLRDCKTSKEFITQLAWVVR